MTMVVTLKALVVWACILGFAVVNGVLRESLLGPAFGAPAALLLSGLMLSALIIGVAYLFLPWMQISRPAHLCAVGLGWLVLTLVFEFSFGLWQGKSLAELLQAYTFQGGNIWPVVLVATALAPYIAAKVRGFS